MAHGGGRLVATLGIVVMGGAALAACGGEAAGSHRAASGAAAPTSRSPTTTAAPNPTTTSAGPGGGGPVLIVRAFGGSVGYDGKKPSTIDFSGDSTNIVQHLTWSSWGPSTAVGEGSLGRNDCQPNCAQGSVRQVPATIHLSDVVNGHFTAMTEKAGGLFRSYRYPSDWAMGAS